jgi:hypothetical protein
MNALNIAYIGINNHEIAFVLRVLGLLLWGEKIVGA